MPVTTIHHDGYVEFNVTGAVSTSSLLAHLAGHFRDRADRRLLWDFTGADVSGVAGDSFPGASIDSVAVTSLRRHDSRTAMLVDSPDSMLLARAFIAWNEVAGGRAMQAFDDRDAALAWLLADR